MALESNCYPDGLLREQELEYVNYVMGEGQWQRDTSLTERLSLDSKKLVQKKKEAPETSKEPKGGQQSVI